MIHRYPARGGQEVLMTVSRVYVLVALLATALSTSALAKGGETPAKKPVPAFGLVTGVLWGYAPSTKEGFALRYGVGVPLLIPAGPVGIALELGASSSFASFDLSPYALLGVSGPVGPVRLGGSVVYSYGPPWDGVGYGSHLVGASGSLLVPVIKDRLALLLSVGPRYTYGRSSLDMGGGVLFAITPG